jgi:hypothetical protein
MTDRASHPVTLPSDSRLAPLYDEADLADAFSISVPAGLQPDIESAARSVFGDPALWFRLLLACRDALVTPLGLKTSSMLRNELQARSVPHINFFPILSRDRHEVVIGADDEHLDFRTSILFRQNHPAIGDEIVVTSVVHCHNLLGRIYLTTIAPFHRIVVRSSLTRALGKMDRKPPKHKQP